MIKQQKILISLTALIAASLIGFPGIRWGLPSLQRMDLVLHPEQRTPLLFDQIAKSRDELYRARQRYLRFDTSLGSLGQKGILVYQQLGFPANFSDDNSRKFDKHLLHSLSSFLIRTNFNDEQYIFVALSNMRIRGNHFDPHFYNYGPPYCVGLGCWLFSAKLMKMITLENDVRFYYQHPQKMGDIYFLARLFSVCCGLLSGLLFGRLALRLIQVKWAFLCTLLFCMAPINIYLGHIIKPHLLGMVFVLMGFHRCANISVRMLKNDYLAAGVYFGLAASTTVNLAPVLLLLLIIHLLRTQREGKPVMTGLLSQHLLISFLTFSVVFLAFSFFLLNPSAWLNQALWESESRALAPSGIVIWAFLRNSFFLGFGPCLCFLSFTGIVLIFHGSELLRRGFLIFLGVYSILLLIQFGKTSLSSDVAAQYMLPALAAMALVAGWGLETLSKRHSKSAAIMAVLALVFSAEQAFTGVKDFVDSKPGKATEMQAGEWINSHIPQGSCIGFLTNNLMTDQYPPFHFLDYALKAYPFDAIANPTSAPEYFLLRSNYNQSSPAPSRPNNFDEIYHLERAFVYPLHSYVGPSPQTNFPIYIYRKKAVSANMA